MKRIVFLLGGLLFCQSAAAVELLASNFSVDLSRFYFSLDVTDLPQFDASFNLYTASACAILPPSHERFHFTFDPDGGTITEGPQVTTTGAPALDYSTSYMRLSLVLAPDGSPVVSYRGSLKVAKCNDNACTGENESIATVDSEAQARSSSIAIGADGLPVISYSDGITGALKVIHCGNVECK